MATSMTPRRPLFDDADPRPASGPRGLTVRPSRGRPLTARQKAFNRLIAKVERLRERFRTEQARLDEALIFHAEHVRPRITQAIRLRTDLVRELAPYLADRRLKAADRRVLSSILIDQLDDVLAHETDPPADLRALFTRLHGVDFDAAVADEMDGARVELEAMFEDMGLDIDLSDFHAGMSEADLAAQAAGLAERVREQARAAESGTRPGRRRSKREAEAEARQRKIDAARKTSLTSIYRRLAKVLHPDLEPDPSARERKSQIMQELTEAHARQDLHTLLRLEIEWMQGEGHDPARLADDAVAIYNEALNQQIAEMEFSLSMLYDHPKYADLIEDLDFGVRIVADGPAQVAALDDAIALLSAGVERLRSDRAFDEVRSAINLRRGPPKRRRAR
jgi:hypothetical protein